MAAIFSFTYFYTCPYSYVVERAENLRNMQAESDISLLILSAIKALPHHLQTKFEPKNSYATFPTLETKMGVLPPKTFTEALHHEQSC